MSSNEIPKFSGGDVRLGPTEAVRFKHEVVWPAIDYKWGGAFWEDSTPGSSLEQELPVYPGQGEYWCQFNLDCDFDSDDEDEELGISHHASLNIYRSNPDLLVDAKKGYLADCLEAEINKEKQGKLAKRERRRIMRGLKRDLATESFTAWERTTYVFSADDEDGFTVAKGIELRDEWDEPVWDTGEAGLGAEEEEHISAELEDISQSLATSITINDYFMIMDAFKALGVPPETFAAQSRSQPSD